MQNIRTEVCVIGSGPGGYVAAIRAGQLGKKVVCVEKAAPGGVCLNVGCIPSKALINAAKQWEKLSHLSTMGISVSGASLDVGKLQEWKGSVVDKLTSGVRQLIKSAGGQFVAGTATLRDKNTIEVSGPEGSYTITADSIILATGSRPITVPGFQVDNQRIHDSTGGLAFREVPRRLTVIGGGYIGLELGTMWRKLGAQVTVVEFTDQLLPGNDPDLVNVVARKLKKLGVEVYLQHKALRFGLGIGYVDAIVKNVDSRGTGVTGDYVAPNAPKWSTNAMAAYTLPVASGKLTFQVDGNYMSRFWFNLGNTPAVEQAGFGLANARVNWASSGDKLELGASLENLANKHYGVMGFDNSSINGLAQRYPGMPRWFKAHVNYKF